MSADAGACHLFVLGKFDIILDEAIGFDEKLLQLQL